MTLEEYKKNNGSKKFSNWFLRIIVSIFILLSVLSLCKLSNNTKELIKKELFETNLNFSKVNVLLSKVFNNKKTLSVSDIGDIVYKTYEPYKDGVKVSIKENEPISLIDSGIVVFIGEKEGYGNTLIVQQSNGVDVWYGNITDINVKLYDYVNKNNIIGSSNGELYLVFQKDGEFLDYKNYIK